jgi:hypothetical protein
MALKYARLFGLLLAAIVATYFTTKVASSIFYIAVFALYLNSRDEPFWLTFYFVVSDGFLGFFNNFEAVIAIIPGLPDVEVGHLYIIGGLIKVATRRPEVRPAFFQTGLALMALYVLFLVVQGYAIGVGGELRHHFRIVKLVLPLALFYTVPRLLTTAEDFRTTFHLFIPFAFLALLAQVTTVATGLAPSQWVGLAQKFWFTDAMKRGHTYRGFYSTGMVLISFFGALYYATVEPRSVSRPLYIAVILANVLSAFLSATRGWVLAMAVVLVLHTLFVVGVKPRQVLMASLLGTAMLLAMLRIPAVRKQFEGASDRILTVGLIAKGDLTAGGTLARLDRRAPRVMKKFRESPITGQGFSAGYFEYGDTHVGNHNILLHSGVIGALLMASFLGWFCLGMFGRARDLLPADPRRRGLLVFPIFLLGWFIIHSTSGQQFQYFGDPGHTLPQAIFFGFAGLVHNESA